MGKVKRLPSLREGPGVGLKYSLRKEGKARLHDFPQPGFQPIAAPWQGAGTGVFHRLPEHKKTGPEGPAFSRSALKEILGKRNDAMIFCQRFKLFPHRVQVLAAALTGSHLVKILHRGDPVLIPGENESDRLCLSVLEEVFLRKQLLQVVAGDPDGVF